MIKDIMNIIQDILRGQVVVCKNYCDNCGNCTRCGNCCAACLPITKKEEKRIKKYIKVHNIEPEFFQSNDYINLNCCFYDRTNKICKIYEVRPNICRSFKCNKNIFKLEKEKEENHKRAYWNKLLDGELTNLIDMRLLFYDDPRSLIGNIIYTITAGTMQCTEKQFEWLNKFLKINGLEELSNCIKGEYKKEETKNV